MCILQRFQLGKFSARPNQGLAKDAKTEEIEGKDLD